MSTYYSHDELITIAGRLVENLRECEDGTAISTSRLLKEARYVMNNFDEGDLLTIHEALFKAARANHITLDMSAHKNKCDGQAYNLDYVVHNKKAQIKCPYCGSKNTARILYGNPIYDERMQKLEEAGKIVLGGCEISTVPVNGKSVRVDPARQCNDCGKEFGTPPLLVAKDYMSAEDYRDIVRSIQFSVGGYFGGETEFLIKATEDGAQLTYSPSFFLHTMPKDVTISPRVWNTILNKLYAEIYLHEWKKNYKNPGVLDGTYWYLEIKLTDGRVRTYKGSNAYPPYWPELVKIFRKYGKI